LLKCMLLRDSVTVLPAAADARMGGRIMSGKLCTQPGEKRPGFAVQGAQLQAHASGTIGSSKAPVVASQKQADVQRRRIPHRSG
jgi:hypothetical protein